VGGRFGGVLPHFARALRRVECGAPTVALSGLGRMRALNLKRFFAEG
jgi:hypothetical protein